MEPEQLLDALLALAREAGLPVQRIGVAAAGEGLAPSASAECRVRGEARVILVECEPVLRRAQVLAAALRRHAPALLEGRYLPPALRDLLEG